MKLDGWEMPLLLVTLQLLGLLHNGVTNYWAISLNDLHVEAGGTTNSLRIAHEDIRNIIDKCAGAQNSISEYYGQSSAVSVFG